MMRRFVAVLAIALLTASFPTSARAQTAGGTLVLSGGVSVPVPGGWQSAPASPLIGMMLAPDGLTNLLVTLQPRGGVDVVSQLSTLIDLGNGVRMSPKGAATSAGGTVSNEFVVWGTVVPAVGFVMAKQVGADQVFGVIGIGPSQSSDSLRSVVQTAFSSAIVTPAASGTVAGGSAAYGGETAPASGGQSPWTAELGGLYLVRFYTGSGYQEQHEIWLCSDGSFARSSEGGGFTAGVASGAFGSGSQGSWSVTGPGTSAGLLTLRANNGSQAQYRVEVGNDGLYLNGNRWMRGNNELCR